MSRRITGAAALTAAMLACALIGASGTGLAEVTQPRGATSFQTKAVSAPAAVAAAASAVLKRTGSVRVSVLCDSVGNDIGEWVNVWARRLAADRDVIVHYFDSGTARRAPGWNPQVQKFAAAQASGKGPIALWTFGWPGGTPDTAVRSIATVFPEKPDLVVYSYGLNVAASNVAPQFARLHAAVRARHPAVPVVGQLAHMTPVVRPGQATGRVELASWALRNGIPLIDQRTVFDAYRDRPDDVFMDAVHPNGAGHVLLAERVEAAMAQPGTMVSASRTARVWVGPRTLNGRTLRFPTAVLDAGGKPLPYAVATVKAGGATLVVEASSTGIAWVSMPTPRRGTLVVATVSNGPSTGFSKFAA